MKIVLSLSLVVLLAVVSVSPAYSEEENDIVRVMTSQQPRRFTFTVPANDRERQMAEIQQYLTMLSTRDQRRNGEALEAESDVIGPNFNQMQFLNMLKRVALAAYQRKCKKVTGDDNAYAKSIEALEQVKACVENWVESEGIMESYNRAEMTKDYKPIIKQVCTKRSDLYGCVDKQSEALYRCLYPSELEMAQRVDRIAKNTLDLICSNDENDYAMYDDDSEAQKCVNSKDVEQKTCANKAAYLGAKRIIEKLIENEHFKFEMEPEDCEAFDTIRNCFVASVENCSDPRVKNMFSSAYQIYRNETQCANTIPVEAKKSN